MSEAPRETGSVAVALDYEIGTNDAPRVVAKGRGHGGGENYGGRAGKWRAD